MGDKTSTSTSTSGSANKDVNTAVSSLAKGLNSLYSPGGTTYVPPGSNTTGSWNAMLSAANNPSFTGGLAGALSSYGSRAAGNELGMDAPGYRAVRDKLQNDITTQVNSSFNNSGLFGSDNNQRSLAEGLSSGLGALDLQQYNGSLDRQAQAAQMLPSLYQALQMPATIQGSVGSAQDADAQAQKLGQLDYLGRFSSILNGTAGSGGTTTTQTQPQNLMMQLLGLGLTAL